MNESATFSDPEEMDDIEVEATSVTEQPMDDAVDSTEDSADASDTPVVETLSADDPPADIDDTGELTVPEPSPDEYIWDGDEDIYNSNETIPLALWNDEAEETPIVKDVEFDPKPLIQVAKVCHVGAVRDRNDDSCFVFTSDSGGHFSMMPFGLYVVADGMGGHANGHVASKVASRVASNHILERIYLPLLRDADAGMQAPIQEVLVDSAQLANTAVYDNDPESDSGTTLTAGLLLGRRLYVAHVADSRAYIMVDGELQTITTDHSLVQRLQEVGQLTEEEAAIYQYRHVLLRAIGQADQVDVDTYMRRLPQTGKLLFCSDGLCGMITDKEIQAIMAQDDISLQEMAEQLFLAAIDGGGYDNITVLLVAFSF